jgi:SNF2 family DNA or RNA helicase
MRDRSELHHYQRHTVDFIKENKRCGLFIGMGLGKTTTTLTALSDMRDEFDTGKILVIAPLRVANHVWYQEVHAWSHLCHLDVSICTGDRTKRLAGLNREADIYVINKENVKWLQEQYGEQGQRWPFRTIVVDESSCLKNPSTQLSKALKRILSKTHNFIILTGTPSPNSLLDLWNQIFMLDYGKSLGRSFNSYKSAYFEADFMGYKYRPRNGSFAHIHNAIQHQVVSLKAEDYLELPDCIMLQEVVSLKKEALKFYKDFEKNYIADIQGEEITAVNAAVLAGRLLQLAGGSVYTDALGNYKELHTEKLEALSAIVDENPDDNMLVAYTYKSDLDRLQKKFPYAVTLATSKTAIADWNKGLIKMMLVNPQGSGHGLNLQYGGSMLIWFGLCWSLEYYLQLNARLHRQGQDKPVRIIHLIAEETMDEQVMSVLSDKNATQRSLLEALKAKL